MMFEMFSLFLLAVSVGPFLFVKAPSVNTYVKVLTTCATFWCSVISVKILIAEGHSYITVFSIFTVGIISGLILIWCGMLWPSVNEYYLNVYRGRIRARILALGTPIVIDSHDNKFEFDIATMVRRVLPDPLMDPFLIMDAISIIHSRPEFSDVQEVDIKRIPDDKDVMVTSFVVTTDNDDRFIVHRSGTIDTSIDINEIKKEIVEKMLEKFNYVWWKIPRDVVLINTLSGSYREYDLEARLEPFLSLFRFSKSTVSSTKTFTKHLIKTGATQETLRHSCFIPHLNYHLHFDGNFQVTKVTLLDELSLTEQLDVRKEYRWCLFGNDEHSHGVPDALRYELEQLVFFQLEHLPVK